MIEEFIFLLKTKLLELLLRHTESSPRLLLDSVDKLATRLFRIRVKYFDVKANHVALKAL